MLKTVLVVLIRGYKRCLSPLLPPACRYLPTCSDYAVEAIHTHGAWRGLWLGSKRLCRCHPWGGSGWDPVPPAKSGWDPVPPAEK
jgi:putative membrane protein insertion efficiency factor